MTVARRRNDDCVSSFVSGSHELVFPTTRDRLSARTLDIANRLRFVCAELDPDNLLALATQMAIVELKYLDGHPELRHERRRAMHG